MRFIDLFAGVGGFHHAAVKVVPDAECVLAVEWDTNCQKVYATSFPGTSLRGDINEVLSVVVKGKRRDASLSEIRDQNLVPEHDVLFAGFPCQPFSKGGAQQGLSERTQGTLFHQIMRIIEARRPQIVILENVANLVGHDEGRTWDTIIRSLRKAQYSVDSEPLLLSPHQIKAARGGAPQNRPRVYIVAVDMTKGLHAPSNSLLLEASDYRSESSPPWNIEKIFKASDLRETQLDEKEVHWLLAWDAFVKVVPVDDLPGFPIWVDAWYGRMRRPSRVEGSTSTLRAKRSGRDIPVAEWWTDFVTKNQHFYQKHAALLDKWVTKWGVSEFPESRRKLEWQARRHHPTRTGRTLKDCLIQFRPSGIRVKPPTYAPALVAMAQTPVVGLGQSWRRIGPAEAGVLQGFTNFRPWRKVMRTDPKFQSGAAYKQFGNAVNIGVAALVLKRTLDHLGLWQHRA